MIKSIRLQNFFSFRDETIELNDDINILLGINGSGKSNFFKAIRLLREGIAGQGLRHLIIDKWNGFDDVFNSSVLSGDKRIVLEYRFDATKISSSQYTFPQDPVYQITITPSSGLNYSVQERLSWKGHPSDWVLVDFRHGRGVLNERKESNQSLISYSGEDPQELALARINDSDRYPVQKIIKDCISEIVIYDFFDTRAESKIRRPVANSPLNYLNSDGTNLVHILTLFQREHQSIYRSILSELTRVNENFREISFRPIGTNFELFLVETSLERAVPLAHISDGTLRYLCLLAIAYNPKRGRFVCIDEPELGLHPDMIRGLAEGIRTASNETQFILSTHHEGFLDQFEIEQIIAIEKDENNSSFASRFNRENFGELAETKLSGVLWDRGHLGARRW
jgi:predicted ATPase